MSPASPLLHGASRSFSDNNRMHNDNNKEEKVNSDSFQRSVFALFNYVCNLWFDLLSPGQTRTLPPAHCGQLALPTTNLSTPAAKAFSYSAPKLMIFDSLPSQMCKLDSLTKLKTAFKPSTYSLNCIACISLFFCSPIFKSNFLYSLFTACSLAMLTINQSIKFYLYSPYSQTTVRLIGL